MLPPLSRRGLLLGALALGTGTPLVVSSALPRASARSAEGLLGGVRRRADWGADESMRRGSPSYASRVSAVVVHHTVQANDYGPDDVPALIQADYRYHVRSRGWSDLGYNLLVDRFGRIWEGRHGGLGRATVGAHADGFNTATLGVAVLGDLTKTTPTLETVRALARVGAYAAGTWDFDPMGEVTLTSRGSNRYRSGTRVTLPRIHVHGATSRTACAGSSGEALPQVRLGAKVLLGPAPWITGTEVTGTPVHAPGNLLVTATGSRESPWHAEVVDPRGDVVHRQSGDGGAAQLRWNGLRPVADGTPGLVPSPPGRHTWTLTLDNGWHLPSSAAGTIEVGLPLVPV